MSIALLQSRHLTDIDGVVHGFTTREGGVSQQELESLNLGLRVGDSRENVAANRGAVLDALGRSDATWVSACQKHESDVVEVTRQASRSLEADGLWTRDREVAVAVLVADCVPILLASEDGAAVAAIHAGWRGTAARIVELAVKRLVRAGFAASKLVAAIGPAIGPCCFEVGEDVAAKLAELSDGEGMGVSTSGARSADLWTLNLQQLLGAGVRPDAIDQFRLCTRCNAASFYSHRRDSGKTGRQAGVIGFS